MPDCETCGKPDREKPMCFRGEKHCSEYHRKVQAGEKVREFADKNIVAQ